jgi:putative oxidoreductase
MENILGRFAPYLYALLRIVAGLLFACHGAQKLFGVLGGQQASLMSQFGLAGVIEFGGGLLIAAGVFTSLVAFIASGEMAFAYFQAHAPRGTFPIQNGGELAVLYCFLFLYFAARGNGALSVQGGKRR